MFTASAFRFYSCTAWGSSSTSTWVRVGKWGSGSVRVGRSLENFFSVILLKYAVFGTKSKYKFSP